MHSNIINAKQNCNISILVIHVNHYSKHTFDLWRFLQARNFGDAAHSWGKPLNPGKTWAPVDLVDMMGTWWVHCDLGDMPHWYAIQRTEQIEHKTIRSLNEIHLTWKSQCFALFHVQHWGDGMERLPLWEKYLTNNGNDYCNSKCLSIVTDLV